MLLHEIDIKNIKHKEVRDITNEVGPNHSKLKEFLAKKCSRYINIAKKSWPRQYLWHGWGDTPITDYFIGKSVYYREPRGAFGASHNYDKFGNLKFPKFKNAQEELDFKLKEIGCTALRSNSIYCLTDYSKTLEFGLPYAIFPLNGFSFTWLDRVLYTWNGSKTAWWSPTYIGEPYINFSTEQFKKIGFSNTNFSKALQSKNEILICGAFVSLNISVNRELRAVTDELLDYV